MFTSCYKRIKRIEPPLVPVCISVGKPAWFRGRCEPRLAPTWAMLKMDGDAYDKAYSAILAQLDPAQLYKDLGENAVLLCWEPTNVRCHRRFAAEWLEEALGIEIAEHGLARADCLPYALAPEK